MTKKPPRVKQERDDVCMYEWESYIQRFEDTYITDSYLWIYRQMERLSQSRHQPRRRRKQRAPQPPLPQQPLSCPQRRGGGFPPAAGRRGAGGWDARVDEVWSAHFVDQRCGLDVVEVEGLGFVGGDGGVEGHCVFEA